MAEALVDGSCGGQKGHKWSYVPEGDEISTTIHITYEEEAIYSISFVTLYENDKKEEKKFGGQGGKGKKDATIELNGKIEQLTGISGTVGKFSGTQVITSLRFITDGNKSYGPFGSVKGASFLLHGRNNYVVSGFHGRCGWWVDDIGVYLRPAPKRAPKIGAGPWGSHDPGNSWTYEPKGSISHISITHDECIYSIKFTSQDVNGKVEQSKKFGSTTGSKSDEVSIDINNEKLNKIIGTYDSKNGYVVVTSLLFSTDKKRVFGPYGVTKGTSFSMVVDNDKFIGFYGRCGSWLDAIGVYLPPKTQIVVGQWGSQEPGNEWSYKPKGLISEISVTHDDAIYSIIFTSEDDKGNVEHSKKFGSQTGSKSDKVIIYPSSKLMDKELFCHVFAATWSISTIHFCFTINDWDSFKQYGTHFGIDIDIKKEKLNYLSGTVDVKGAFKVITSISFKTDQNKAFGPFGVAHGTAFSLPVTNGYFSGFHGRAGFWLDAIGVYVHPT